MFYFFSISFAEFIQSFRLLNIVLSTIQSFYLCPFTIYTHTHRTTYSVDADEVSLTV